jgi:hypothetical protein
MTPHVPTPNTQHPAPTPHHSTTPPLHHSAAGLSPKQSLALTALLQGATQAHAARQAGCSERSIRGWLKEPAFFEALQEARAGLWLETTLRAEDTARQAINTVQQMIREADTPTARLRAAKLALDFSLKLLRAEPLFTPTSGQETSCFCSCSCSESTPSPPRHAAQREHTPPQPAKTGQKRPLASGKNGERAGSRGEGEAPAEPAAVGAGTHTRGGQNRPEPDTGLLPNTGSGNQPLAALPVALCAKPGKNRQKPAAAGTGRAGSRRGRRM